jgi:DNA polymerase-3 subunit alpha
VLEQAQAAGQKVQQDAQIGQGSIFDLEPALAPAGGGGSALVRPAHPPIPPGEFDQAELLAIEKEAIGLFISAHPLKPVREALRQRIDCPLSEVAERRDKDWVTVGGIITQAKRIRTRNGDHMMFATLDDLEGSVEVLVFGKALAEYEGALAVDQLVIVRGRVDHKEAGKTCVVAQTIDPFAPTEQEAAEARVAAGRAAEQAAKEQATGLRALRLRLDATCLPVSFIDELKAVLESFPGPSDVVLEMATSTGARRLRLGEAYRVAPGPSLHAELAQLLGPAALPAG